MLYIKISQLNVLLQACTILVISCLLLKIIDGEEWPVIVDPFPDDPDIIGTEAPPTAPDCTLACQERIDEAMNLINHLQQQLANTNSSLITRIDHLEANSNNGGDPLLTLRVHNLEQHLPANVSLLHDKINADIDSLRRQMRDEILQLKRDLELKIGSIPSGGGDDGKKATEVYMNLTQRINNLENGKVQSLINDNKLWRQNFRVVNNTFAKLKKSSFGNTVVLTG